jgi:diguanylate cyclase
LQQELEHVRAKSMTDGLTRAFNREALDQHLSSKIEAMKTIKAGFCLLLLDLDDFKSLNDTYGHLIGDRMLMAFSQKCRSLIRGDDFFARYGGEEFAIVLNNINLRDGLMKASDICKTVAAARYATDENQADNFLSMTVSIGVTPVNRSDTVESLIARADKALYDAKRKGKNMAIGRKG